MPNHMEKLKKYGPLPNYNQETQYIIEKEPIDMGDHLYIELEVRDLDIIDSSNLENERLKQELLAAKLDKIKELSRICNNEIVAGFISTVKFNEPKLYDMQLENQINMMGLLNELSFNTQLGIQNPIIIEYYPKGEQCVDYTLEEFIQLCKEATIFKTEKINKYKSLTKQVDDVDTIEELDNVNW